MYNLLTDVQADDTPAVDVVLKADKKRTALLEEVGFFVPKIWPFFQSNFLVNVTNCHVLGLSAPFASNWRQFCINIQCSIAISLLRIIQIGISGMSFFGLIRTILSTRMKRKVVGAGIV